MTTDEYARQMRCTRCAKDAIACDCNDMEKRLKNCAVGQHSGVITAILIARQKLGKDIPRVCCKPQCTGTAKYIPIIKVPAPRRIDKKKIVWVEAEMLNTPLCQVHKDAAKVEDFITPENAPEWVGYFTRKQLRPPIMDRLTMTFRELAEPKPTIILP